jgi:hypothetical protein
VLFSRKGLAVIVELSGELFAINTGKTTGMNKKQLSTQGYPKGLFTLLIIHLSKQ